MKRALARRALVAFWGRSFYLVAVTVVAMAAADYVSSTVAHFVAAEVGVTVVDGVFSAVRPCAVVAVVDVEAVIYIAVEVMRAVEPGAGSDEDAAVEPFRSVIAVGGAFVRRIVIVPVGTYRRGSDLDRDLCVRTGGANEEQSACHCQQTNIFR
jgi:hypothetical protein